MSEDTKFTRQEVAEHNSSKSAWLIIDNKVYDTTTFLDEHPGGCEVLLERCGADATEAFEDIGHSMDAREMKDGYFVGEIVDEEKQKYFDDTKGNAIMDAKEESRPSVQDGYLVRVAAFALTAVILYQAFGRYLWVS